MVKEKVNLPLTVAAIQGGPSTDDKWENLRRSLDLIDEAAKNKPNVILFNELFTTKYFATVFDPKYYKLAEPIPGPTTEAVAEKAKRYNCYIICPIYEKGRVEGEYFNSTSILGPNGELVYGTLPDGQRVHCYSKTHLPMSSAMRSTEKLYFNLGFGFPTFEIAEARIGILTCYDRLFPEGWRCLVLQGAEIIFIPIASWGQGRSDPFIQQLRTLAELNQVFVVAANKSGKEVMEGSEKIFFGSSCVVDPSGKVIAKGPQNEGPAIISATIDIGKVSETRIKSPFLRDRRPEIYQIITQIGA